MRKHKVHKTEIPSRNRKRGQYIHWELPANKRQMGARHRCRRLESAGVSWESLSDAQTTSNGSFWWLHQSILKACDHREGWENRWAGKFRVLLFSISSLFTTTSWFSIQIAATALCWSHAPFSPVNKTLRFLNSFTWGRNSLTQSGNSTLFILRTMASDLEILILIPTDSHLNTNCYSASKGGIDQLKWIPFGNTS